MKRRPKRPIDESGRELWKFFMRSDMRSNKGEEDRLHQYLIDLLESNEPLDREIRDLVASDLRCFYFPDQAPKKHEIRKEQHYRQNEAARTLKKMLRDCGMTAGDAEGDVTAELGISVDALRKRLGRPRRPVNIRWPGAWNRTANRETDSDGGGSR